MTEASFDEPLNTIEIRQRDAILAAGQDPAWFLFDAQLDARARNGRLSQNQVRQIQALRDWAPSRFELVELLPLYQAASQNINTFQRMSADRVPFEQADFVVATEPGHLVTATVDSRYFAVSASDHSGPARAREAESIVWLNVGSVNLLKLLGTHIRHALVAPHGNLPDFLLAAADANVCHLALALMDINGLPARHAEFMRQMMDDPRQAQPSPAAAGRASVTLPPFNTGPMDDALLSAQTMLIYGFVTFLAGHEAGHIYLGHTGIHPRTTYLPSLAGQMTQGLADEIDADSAGLISVWDGMSANYETSIDQSWLSPVLFLAAHAGLAGAAAAADPSSAQAAEDFNKWVDRLRLMVRAIGANLSGNSFGSERSGAILNAVPPLAGAVYAWLQAGGMRTLDGVEPPLLDRQIHDILSDDCDHLKTEFGL